MSHYQWQARSRCRGRASRATCCGFTLIELLAVIAIIVVLVALIMPALSKAKTLARRASCMSNLRNLGSASGTYQCSFGENVPICWRNIDPSVVNPWKSWRVNLLPFASGFTAFNCPAAFDWEQRTELFHSVEELTTQDWNGTANAGTYGVMYEYSRPAYTAVNYAGVVTQGHPIWSNSFPSTPGVAWATPAASVYVADACLTQGPVVYPSQGHRGLGTSSILPPSEPAYSDGSVAKRFADRHAGTNCLFVDGHIQSIGTRELDRMVPGSSTCIWDVD
jgi:prepilin-type N-terminal cleavage/methylation domain-containing protein/prepilin-type processing-associated H-X9-DG protein